MQKLLPRTLAIVMLVACNAGYGPLQDRSQFVSVRLADDGRTVLFSYHRFLYRPAAGIRAFPDGGIPKYETDVNFLGALDRPTGKVRILRREKNTDWQPGSGNFTVHSMNGPRALVSQGGQLRGPFALGVRFQLVDLDRGSIEDLDLKADLARHDRDTGQIYLADPDGTLVFITLSLAEAAASGPPRSPEPVPEIWVRTPRGDYMKAASNSHYERMIGGEVIYWEPSTRDFMAFSPRTKKTRKAPEYKIPPYQDVSVGVILASDRKSLEYGVKTGDQWRYEPLPVDTNDLR